MIRQGVVAAAALISGLAVPAFADPSFPTSFSTAVTNAVPPPGVSTIPSGVNSDELNAIDGVLTGYSFNLAANPQVVTVLYTISFVGSTVALGGDLHVFIYNWATVGSPTTVLRDITWVHGAESAAWTGINQSFVNGDTQQVFGANDLSNYTTITGGFDRNLADTLLLTFRVTTSGSGDVFVFDAVSNPEPGTMALFGLGALGLGGLVWRRRGRKARKTA